MVLPNFQRSFVWKLTDVRELLVSFLLDYPVGSFLTVEAKSDLFDERPLLSETQVPREGDARHVTYLLDGQQRLSSCELIFGDVWMRDDVDDAIRRRWFLNLARLGLESLAVLSLDELVSALEPGSDAIHYRKVSRKPIKSRPESLPAREPHFRTWCVEQGFYPLSAEVLKQEIDFDLIGRIADHRHYGKERGPWLNWISKLLSRLAQAKIPTIEIPTGPDTLEKVARIFETVNKTGARLGLFDLVVARAARTIKLREKIQLIISGFQVEVSPGAKVWPVEVVLEDEQSRGWQVFLAEIPKVIAALAQFKNGAENADPIRLDLSKRAILKTNPEDIAEHAETAALQLVRAFHFTQTRCGAPWQISECAYQQMLLPLSICLTAAVVEDESALKRLEAWYWAAIFTGKYKSAQDTQSRIDAVRIRDYVWNHSAKPQEVIEISAKFLKKDDFLEATQPGDGLFRAVQQFVLSCRPLDLHSDGSKLDPEHPYTAEPHGTKGKVRDVQWEGHHIVPRAWVSKNGASLPSASFVNSCLNRTWVSRRANRGQEVGAFDQNPHQYLALLPVGALGAHSIPVSLASPNPDPLGTLIDARYEALTNRIQKRVNELS